MGKKKPPSLKEAVFSWSEPVRADAARTWYWYSVGYYPILTLIPYIYRLFFVLFKNMKVEVGQLQFEVAQLYDYGASTRAVQICISCVPRG